MTVREIIKNYLKERHYDGLCGDGCGCGIDNLFPCGEINTDCQPAYAHKCDPVACKITTDCQGAMGSKCYRVDRPVQNTGHSMGEDVYFS